MVTITNYSEKGFSNVNDVDEEMNNLSEKYEKLKNEIIKHSLSTDAGNFFYDLRFKKILQNPLSPNGKKENFSEILNQFYTYLASYLAVKKLLKIHKGKNFLLCLGNENGPDIYSDDDEIVAEVFCCTKVSRNDKLRKDATKVIYEYYFKKVKKRTGFVKFEDWIVNNSLEKDVNKLNAKDMAVKMKEHCEKVVMPHIIEAVDEDIKSNFKATNGKLYIYFYAESFNSAIDKEDFEVNLYNGSGNEQYYKYYKGFEEVKKNIKINRLKKEEIIPERSLISNEHTISFIKTFINDMEQKNNNAK